MITKRDKIKCDVCGKFIAYNDIGETAYHNLVYPQSDLTEETWESYCPKCNDKPQKKTMGTSEDEPCR